MVKAVVDLEQQRMAIDAQLHADLEKLLISEGSSQRALWGINLLPDYFGQDAFVEFDSLINIRVRDNNPSRDVLDATIRAQIMALVNRVVKA